MRSRILIHALLATATIAAVGCSGETTSPAPAADAAAVPAFRVGSPRGAIWAGGELFAVIAPPATFSQANGPFDELYVGGNGFKDGVGAISDAGPGDPDYRGGRWHVNVLKASVDPDKYVNASSDDQLDPADFMSTSTYFECPLIPRRGA